jgi:subfamily B ATP-binding cassette protein MsbA
VIETGRHGELVAAGGLYSRLDQLQHAKDAPVPALTLVPTESSA